MGEQPKALFGFLGEPNTCLQHYCKHTKFTRPLFIVKNMIMHVVLFHEKFEPFIACSQYLYAQIDLPGTKQTVATVELRIDKVQT